MKSSATISAIAVEFPEQVRTNDYWLENYPELFTADKKKHATIFSEGKNTEQLSIWDEEVAKYWDDPFGGAQERRVMQPTDSVVSMACSTIRKVLTASNKQLEEIEMIISTAMFPEHVDEGDAAYIAGELGYQGMCWSLNSMCASPMMALKLATGLIESGQHTSILIVSTCSYSRMFAEHRSTSFMIGDGFGAFLVEATEEPAGVLYSKFTGTAESRGLFYNAIDPDTQRRIHYTPGSSKLVAELTQRYMKELIAAFFEEHPITTDEIDFFISFNATAWYSAFFCKELGIPPSKTNNIFPKYGNISGVSVIAALHQACQDNQLQKGDLVLIYNHGFTSNAGLLLLRWGDVALG